MDIAKAALAGDHKVVATGRNTDKVAKALGKFAELLVVKLDITKPADAESAVKAAVDKGATLARQRWSVGKPRGRVGRTCSSQQNQRA